MVSVEKKALIEIQNKILEKFEQISDQNKKDIIDMEIIHDERIIKSYNNYVKKINSLILKILKHFLVKLPKNYRIVKISWDKKVVAWQLYINKSEKIYDRKVIIKYYLDCEGNIYSFDKRIYLDDFRKEMTQKTSEKISIVKIEKWETRYREASLQGHLVNERINCSKYKEYELFRIYVFLGWFYVKNLYFLK